MAENGTSKGDVPRMEVPEGYTSRTEGMATILEKGNNEVFYNPVQVVNRDLSIAAINYYALLRQTTEKKIKRHRGDLPGSVSNAVHRDGIHILEGLAASGLRSVRYAKEIEGVTKIIANDLDPSVVAAMETNIKFNGPDVQKIITPNVGDARLVMLQNPCTYDVVDLDPYGSPCQLLDGAVQAIDEGGLLLVTATDMAVLCGNNGETCFGKYGAYPLHRPYCHEMGLRIVLGAIHTAASRYKRYIVPVVSLSIDFYVRIFVRVYTSPAETKNAALKMGYVYQSSGCDSFFIQRSGRKILKGNNDKYTPGSGPAVPQKCPETGQGYIMGGPLWLDPLHDQQWIRGILSYMHSKQESFAAYKKIRGLLTAALEELPDQPLYLNLHDISRTLRCNAPRMDVFCSALINAGFKVSGTHCNPLGVKTNAPWSAIWDIMRCWVQEHPIKAVPESVSARILEKEPELKADFSKVSSLLQQRQKRGKGKVSRYLPNPEANWGPKTRHGRKVKDRQVLKKQQGNGNNDNNGDDDGNGGGDGADTGEEVEENEADAMDDENEVQEEQKEEEPQT